VKTLLINDDCQQAIYSQEVADFIKGRDVCVVTDPPFNIGYHYNTYKDKLDEEEYIEGLSDMLTALTYKFVVIHYPETLYKISFQTGMFPEKVVSWVYNSNTAKQHRDIAFFGVKPDFRKVKQPYKNPNDKRIRELIRNGSGGVDYMTGGTLTKLKTFKRKR